MGISPVLPFYRHNFMRVYVCYIVPHGVPKTFFMSVCSIEELSSCSLSFIVQTKVKYSCILVLLVPRQVTWALPRWIVICISVCIRPEGYWNIFSLLHFKLYIMINHEVPGYILKDPEGYWNSFDLSWCIMIYYDISQSPMGKSFVQNRVSWRITICHDLHHNISERLDPKKVQKWWLNENY